MIFRKYNLKLSGKTFEIIFETLSALAEFDIFDKHNLTEVEVE